MRFFSVENDNRDNNNNNNTDDYNNKTVIIALINKLKMDIIVRFEILKCYF